MATSLSFCDQANWQSRIAAKPAQGFALFLLAIVLSVLLRYTTSNYTFGIFKLTKCM
jgi:hypothetical protein